METMLLTEALDKRDFLKKKIKDAIARFNPMDFKINSAEKCALSVSKKEDFEKATNEEWQSIQDLIKNLKDLNTAIIRANATTTLKSGEFEGMSIAEAISLRDMLKGPDNFDQILLNKFSTVRANIITSVDGQNAKVRAKYDQLTNAVIAKPRTETDSDNAKDIELLNTMKEKDSAVIVDPIGIDKLISDLEERKQSMITSLNSAIKVANATTVIKF